MARERVSADMQSSFANVFKYHMSGQLIARLCSFLINLYLIRAVDLSLLGFISIRMNLFYQTVGFLSREPLRKTCLSPNLSIKDSLHYALLSAVLFIVLGVVCCFIWWFLPLPDVDLHGNYNWVLLVFMLSTLAEGVAEPIAILSLKMGENAHFAFGQSLLTLLQKAIALVLILLRVDALVALCAAQLGASVCYCLIHLRKFFTHYKPLVRKSFCGSWTGNFVFYRYEMKYLVFIGTLLAHSILKQFITDGSGYIMAFTNIFSLKTQAVYDAVERLASLVTRLVLTPLEESAAIYFSSNVRHHHTAAAASVRPSSPDADAAAASANAAGAADRGGSSSTVPKKTVDTFASLLRLVLILGMVVCVFGVPYSRIAVQLYGGEILVENEGAKFLSLYTIYIFFMAINGIVECFAFASMDTPQIFSHGTFLLFSAVLHLFLNLTLSAFVGASGFIVANCLNTILRIYYNWQHIRAVLGGIPRQLSASALLPSASFLVLLVFAFFVTTWSMLIFGNTGGFIHSGAHIAVGGVMFVLVLGYIYQSEDHFANFMEKIQ